MRQQPPGGWGAGQEWSPQQPRHASGPRSRPALAPRAPAGPRHRRSEPAEDSPTVYLTRSADIRDLPGPRHRNDHLNEGHSDEDYADEGYFDEDDGEYDSVYDEGHAEGYDDGFDDEDLPPADDDLPPRRGGGKRPAGNGGGRVARTLGEIFLTAGMVVLLFVVYEVYVTDIFSAQKQASATDVLNHEWDTVGRSTHYDLTDGHGIAKMYIPSFGTDYHFTIIEGTSDADLAIGPGHYVGTALPGEPGDFAVAGHRVGQGDPFNDLDLLQSCDAIVVETASDWYIYRVLPMVNEVAGWTTGKGTRALCSGVDGDAKVTPLGGLYADTVGQETVLPSETDVIATVPHHPTATVSTGQEASLMTLTTCTPKFSSTHRLIVHAVFVKQYAKNPNNVTAMPPEMKETS